MEITEVSALNSFTVAPFSLVNGAKTTYNFGFVPTIDMVSTDTLAMTFPVEVGVPTSGFSCTAISTPGVSSLSCT